MKTQDKIEAVARKALSFSRRWLPPAGSYPTTVLDLIIFHKLHLALPAADAARSFRQLKDAFVDWNEVRISSVREIQGELAGEGTLDVAVFIKDLLEIVHRERQDVSLEFIIEQNLGEIRRYLKQVKGMDSATIDLILRVRKEHPLVPLNQAMEAVLARLGVLRATDTRDRKGKILHEALGEDSLPFHHFLLEHSRSTCPPDESRLDCPRCVLRDLCDFYARTVRKLAKRSARSRRPEGRRAPLRAVKKVTRGQAVAKRVRRIAGKKSR